MNDDYVTLYKNRDVLVACSLASVRVEVGGRLVVVCKCHQDDLPYVRIWCSGVAVDVAADDHGPVVSRPHYPEEEA